MSSVQKLKNIGRKAVIKTKSIKKQAHTNKNRENVTKAKALEYLATATNKITKENKSSDAEYSDLQHTWNSDISKEPGPIYLKKLIK